MDPSLHAQLLARLAASDLAEDAQAVIREAAGPAPSGADPDGDAASAGAVYLRSVSVEGFRGIGPEATLTLDPQPGLTIVVGRNGSGKSSFAEGLELLATGETRRWAERTKGWSSTWQCLHHEGPTRLRAELAVAGEAEPVVLEQTWERGVEHTDTTGRAAVAQALAARGWDRALTSFRPFLAYAELAAMFDKLTSLPTALSPVLGLEDVDELLGTLTAERLAGDAAVKEQKATLATLTAALDEEDERQAALARLLEGRRPDPAPVREHLDAHPPGVSATGPETADLRRAVAAAAAVPDDDALAAAAARVAAAERARDAAARTDATRALAVADLLTGALAARDTTKLTDDCPVCGTVGVLDEAWATAAAASAQALREQAAELAAADRERTAAVGAWRALAERLAPGTAQPGVVDLAGVTAGAATVRAEGAAAEAALAGQDGAWRAVAARAEEWAGQSEAVAAGADRLAAVKAAEKWLKAEADVLRNDRFAPIAQQAVANWELLRHESNVSLHDITLRSVGKRREATFDVRADGETANALGVMSQGELLALSVSVFLPRASLDESPFRFAVIDDPVQSMDPAKVDGLARVLHRSARTRQVVVFTHDDRLPEAVRRLRLPATVLQVNRRSRSQVSVAVSQTPLLRHLKDARHMALTDRIPADVRQRVVPTLCRGALEAACAELVRRRVAEDGLGPEEADARLAGARTLKDQLAVALLEDPADREALMPELARRGGADAPVVVNALNAGAHAAYPGDVLKLRERTHEVVMRLMA